LQGAKKMNVDFPVSEPTARKLVLKTIADAYGIRRDLTHNPCAAPTSLLRAHLPLLQNGYVVTEKSDGVRYLLVFARLKKTSFACLVDRALAMFQIEVRAPTMLFEGSVFDCELVAAPQGHKLLVFDCIQMRAASLRKHTFARRYAKMTQFVGDDKLTCAQFPVIAKSFVPLTDLSHIKVDQLGHASDGFILQPTTGQVVWGRDKHCFKWKYHPSVDVQVEKGALRCLEGLLPSDSDWVLHSNPPDGLWECEASVDKHQGRRRVTLTPLRLRTDKLDANSSETIVGVVKEIEDSVQLWELSGAM
jgi:hypothetical protein